MSPHEDELRDRMAEKPFIPFSLVMIGGDRIKVPTPDHLDFAPTTDDEGRAIPQERWSDAFIVWGNGRRHRVVFFDAIGYLDMSGGGPGK